jgi:outer membrane protein TolC
MKYRVALVTMIMGLSWSLAAWAEDSHPDHGSLVGTNIAELISIARQMNPDLQVAALEADAAAAKVEGAGSLADPKVQTWVMDWRRSQSSYLPSNPLSGTTKKVYVSQEFPFWGKRDLKREIAEANAHKASVMRRQVENELIAKIKTAYAEYHSAHLVNDLAQNLRDRLGTVVRLASARYAQGQGKQQDVTRAEVEKSMLETEIARTTGERQKARVKINRLLGRKGEGLLIEAPEPRRIPSAEALDLADLTARAQQSNPEILVQQAAIEGSDKSVSLAEKSWYPDFEVSVGAVKSQGDWSGYEAMVGANIPLRWGLRDSEIGEAKAMAGAARTRREVLEQDIGNAMADAWIEMKSSREVEKLLRENQIPLAEIGFKAAAKGYELGRTDFLDVLTAEQQLWKSNIELIKVQFDQQIRLAEIEKLVGGDL